MQEKPCESFPLTLCYVIFSALLLSAERLSCIFLQHTTLCNGNQGKNKATVDGTAGHGAEFKFSMI